LFFLPLLPLLYCPCLPSSFLCRCSAFSVRNSLLDVSSLVHPPSSIVYFPSSVPPEAGKLPSSVPPEAGKPPSSVACPPKHVVRRRVIPCLTRNPLPFIISFSASIKFIRLWRKEYAMPNNNIKLRKKDSIRRVLYYALRSMPYGNSFHGLGHACRQASLSSP